MKVIFAGDTHLDSRTPLSRNDNYRETTLKKLRSLKKLAKSKGADTVILTGDLFNRYDIPISYLNEVMLVLKEFKNEHIEVYTLIGNHDLPRNMMEYFKTTPLSLLFESGLIQGLNNKNVIELDNAIIHGMNFTELDTEFDKLSLDKANILVMHYASENTVPNESVPLSELTDFDIVVSGHDHTYYTPLTKHGVKLYRPGSFTRLTKDAKNIKDNITLYMYDTESNKMEELHLPDVEPAENVFKSVVFTGALENIYGGNYDGLFSDLSKDKTIHDIFDIIDDLPLSVTEKSITTITNYLKTKGISRKKSKKESIEDLTEMFSS